MELHFEEAGHGPPLVILHGLFGSLENWQGAGKRLAQWFRVIAVDQRNHGRSPHADHMDYPLMADDVAGLLVRQKLNPSFVLGHSMGGKTAMQLALAYPDVVKKLVVVDIAPRAYSPSHLRIIAGMRSLDLGHFKSRRDMEAALAPAVPDISTRQFLLKNIGRTETGTFSWKLGLEEINRNYAKLTESIRSPEPFLKPTLFIRGEKSDYLAEDDLDSIRRLFPQAQLKTVAGAGHLVHVENPEGFLSCVVPFLCDP